MALVIVLLFVANAIVILSKLPERNQGHDF